MYGLTDSMSSILFLEDASFFQHLGILLSERSVHGSKLWCRILSRLDRSPQKTFWREFRFSINMKQNSILITEDVRDDITLYIVE